MERLRRIKSLKNDIVCSNISGSGLEDINGVFEESNTYQPAVPSNEAEIIVSNMCV